MSKVIILKIKVISMNAHQKTIKNYFKLNNIYNDVKLTKIKLRDHVGNNLNLDN